MGTEIERKFLVKEGAWREASATRYRQGYLSTVKERTVRVRTISNNGYLTIKGITVGASRLEFEYEIPAADADELLDSLCEKPLIEKNRYKVDYGTLTWEVDEFFGENEGLIVAAVELQSEDQLFDRGRMGDRRGHHGPSLLQRQPHRKTLFQVIEGSNAAKPPFSGMLLWSR